MPPATPVPRAAVRSSVSTHEPYRTAGHDLVALSRTAQR